MKLGMRLPERGAMANPDQLTTLVEHATKHGFYAVEFGDHFTRPLTIRSKYPDNETGEAPIWDDWLEQLTTLSFLSAKADRIRLVAGVMVLPYRNPIIAAKMLASIDILSKGRLIVGVGIGWLEEEFKVLGAPPFSERGSVSDEYIKILKELWTDETPEFRGKYFSLSGIRFLPKTVQQPHPPIWVGGESRSAMKRAAFLCDSWYPICTNPIYPLQTAEQLQLAITKLSSYDDEANRGKRTEICLEVQHFKQVSGSVSSNQLFVGDENKIASDIQKCEKLGVSYIGFDLRTQEFESTMANYDQFAEEIMPKLTDDF